MMLTVLYDESQRVAEYRINRSMSGCQYFSTSPGMVTQLPPWAAHPSVCSLFQRINFSEYPT